MKNKVVVGVSNEATELYGSILPPERYFLVPHEQNGHVLPDIAVLHDDGQQSYKKELQRITLNRTQTAVFIVSSDARPESVVDAMKSGAAEYFTTPVDPQRILDAAENVRRQLQAGPGITRGTIYSFISSKGGLGATVTAVNTAAALAQRRRRGVALLDLSLQSGDCTVFLDQNPHRTMADLCSNIERLDSSLLSGAMERHACGLDLLAAPPTPEESAAIHAEHVRKIFDLAANLYEVLVVDCPSMFVNDCSMEAFRMSDRVFIVTDNSIPAIRNTSRIIHACHKAGIEPGRLEVVLNRYLKGKTPSIEEIEKSIGKRLFWLFPNDFEALITSINRGVPLVQQDHRASFGRSILEFIASLENPESSKHYRGIKGFMGKAV
jgi:pilus assembly protein CpaE